MGKVRMLHPSSGRNNFNTVSNEATAASNDDQVSQTIIKDEGLGETTNIKEVEEKTKDALKVATASLSQASPNNINSDKKE
ncbi:unnamed protein product [Rotaria sp. Silwood1]|nr:unnamed protein product [Rotaria sp. Silwood1]CAF5004589.1 unnamed protein product [Rotaria sp. Silwood1]